MKKNSHLRRETFKSFKEIFLFLILTILSLSYANAQFVHPGLSHKKSDLKRMKYMVQSKIDPWYTSYQNMCANSTASYDAEILGDVSVTYIDDDDWKDSRFDNDARVAYYGALR